MAKSINTLLAKKGWTGEEVGKALVASLLNDIRNQGKAEYEQLFTQADFERMESSLKTDRDFLAYGVYRDIYSSIVDTFNKGQGLYQQFYNGYYRYLMNLRGAMRADEALAEIEKYPLIMTEEQYSQVVAETLAQKRSEKLSYYELLFIILYRCMERIENGDTDGIPATILTAIEATKAEPVTNKRILSHYAEDYGEGYYTLPDGRRSDEMTDEEWHNALQELYLKTHKLTINGEPASPEETIRTYNSERLLAGYELYFKGEDAIREAFKEKTGRELEGDASEILNELELVIDGFGKTIVSPQLRKDLQRLYSDETPTEWHYYEDTPEDLTKYDIIADTETMGRYDGSYIGREDRKGDIPEKDQLKEFKQDYPALYDALDAYIRESVPTARDLKPAQLFKPLLSAGELIDSGIIGWGSNVSTPSITDYMRSTGDYKPADIKRAFLRGIAVIKEPNPYSIDEKGRYIEDADPLSRLESLDAIAEDEAERGELQLLRGSLIAPALAYLYAYNALILLIGEVYDIDGIEVAQLDTTRFESQLTAFNNLIYSFYYSIYGEEAEKARKRKLIKDLFQPIDYEALKPTAEAIEAVREDLIKAGISTTARKHLKDIDSLINRLESGEGAN